MSRVCFHQDAVVAILSAGSLRPAGVSAGQLHIYRWQVLLVQQLTCGYGCPGFVQWLRGGGQIHGAEKSAPLG